MNCLDADVERLLRFFTDLPIAEIQKMCKEDIVKAKKFMAFKTTELVHGTAEALKAQETANNLFISGNADDMPREVIICEKQINILDFLSKLSIIKSKSEARRLIEQGGILIENERKNNINEVLQVKNEMVIKKSKKTFVKVIVRK